MFGTASGSVLSALQPPEVAHILYTCSPTNKWASATPIAFHHIWQS